MDPATAFRSLAQLYRSRMSSDRDLELCRWNAGSLVADILALDSLIVGSVNELRAVQDISPYEGVVYIEKRVPVAAIESFKRLRRGRVTVVKNVINYPRLNYYL